MKIIRVKSGFLFIVMILFLSSCSNKSSEDGSNQNGDSLKLNDAVEAKALYNEMRNKALSTTSEKMSITSPTDSTKIYGVIMDWDIGDATATLISFSSGDASLYLSSGGAVIGGAGHENVRLASKAFVNKSEKYLDKAVKTESTSLPGKGFVKFYFLTAAGKFVAEEEMIHLENNSSPWLDLFEEGNKLITEIRTSTPEK